MSRCEVFDLATEALRGVVCDGMLVACGGFGLCGMPETLIDALLETEVKDLTVVSNNAGTDGIGLVKLIEAGRIKKMLASYVGNNPAFEAAYLDGRIELEFSPQGTMSERLRAGGAGIPAFYTKTGVGTVIAEGKPTAKFDGVTYLQELAIVPDLALVRAERADRAGNLVYRKAARNFNPMMAAAGAVTIAEVERIVATGELDSETIQTPGIYVDRLIRAAVPKRIEFVTNRGPDGTAK